MTTEELIQKVGALVASRRDREALELASKHLYELAPSMTSEQIVTVADFAHIAQMAVDLEEWDAANRQAEAEAQVTRRS